MQSTKDKQDNLNIRVSAVLHLCRRILPAVRGRTINEPGYSRLIPLVLWLLVASDSEMLDLIG